MIRSQGIQDLLDGQTRRLFKLTAAEAHTLLICIRCRAEVSPWTWEPLDRNEWFLSALCPSCYDAVTEDCE